MGKDVYITVLLLLFTDKCSQITCQNGGICIIENEKAVCNCTDKYTGLHCEKGE